MLTMNMQKLELKMQYHLQLFQRQYILRYAPKASTGFICLIVKNANE